MGRSKGNELIQVLLIKQLVRKCRGIANARKLFSLKHWRYLKLAWGDAELEKVNIPKGHIPVYVGNERRRFIIPTAYFNHPIFRSLLRKAEEEFGFDHQMGLMIPCEEDAFEYLTSLMAGKVADPIAAHDLDLDLDLE